MPQLDVYTFTSLIYPVVSLFLCFFLFSYIILFALATQQFAIKSLISFFNFTKPQLAIYYRIGLLRAIYFREALIYSTTTQLVE